MPCPPTCARPETAGSNPGVQSGCDPFRSHPGSLPTYLPPLPQNVPGRFRKRLAVPSSFHLQTWPAFLRTHSRGPGKTRKPGRARCPSAVRALGVESSRTPRATHGPRVLSRAVKTAQEGASFGLMICVYTRTHTFVGMYECMWPHVYKSTHGGVHVY